MELLIDLREMNDYFQDRFKNKDIVKLSEFLGDYEELIWEVETLTEENEKLKHPEKEAPVEDEIRGNYF